MRMYAFVQFFTLLARPLLLLVARPKFTHGYMIMIALACCGVSKLTENKNHEIWQLRNGLSSGPAIKHLAAALGCYILLAMLKIRRPLV